MIVRLIVIALLLLATGCSERRGASSAFGGYPKSMYAQKGKALVEAVAAGSFDTAYAMFSSGLKQQISMAQFRKVVDGGKEFPIHDIKVDEDDIRCDMQSCDVPIFFWSGELDDMAFLEMKIENGAIVLESYSWGMP